MRRPAPKYKQMKKAKSYKDYLKEDQEKGNPAAIEAKIPNKYYKNNVSKYDL
jgi:hypothetical protein